MELRKTIWIIIAAVFVGIVGGSPRCRCLPGHKCWPSAQEWEEFNATVKGRLILPRPTAYPCYAGPDFNEPDCQTIRVNFSRPSFLLDRAGSMQNFNWEDLDGKRCSLEAADSPDAVCETGSVSVFGVAVHSVADIRKTVSFARRHNLRLVVKSTGHDYLGRSAAPGSLLLRMHTLSDVETRTSFYPDGCSTDHDVNTPVVIVSGGKTWDDVYKKVDEDFNSNYVAVGGICHAISAAGGYTLGGGHSVLGPSFGLAVDNVLQIQLVTADGKFVTANPCQNQDLFWALRGGGGGTFGITNTNNSGVLTQQQVEVIPEVLARRSPELDEKDWGGLFYYNPAYGFSLNYITPHKVYRSPMDGLKDELIAMQSTSGFLVSTFSDRPFLQHFRKFQNWHRWIASDVYAMHYNAGTRVVGGSRLIPNAALSDPRQVAKTLVAGMQRNGFEWGILGHAVLGDGVRNNPEANMTSVTPAWRQAAWHPVLFTVWEHNASQETVTRLLDALNAGTEVWRQAYPDSGAYFNEAFTEEPSWQEAFWGANYARLLDVKKRVDPEGLFVCRQCVGSEMWDRSGNCRV
ncbi:uncharacterized protein LOC129581924 isoform X2 [Paramacrobiotus metropolitanus]|uniref:uncharacterized protein LOC129581924 isoform X2 n=1 Tax=Paramacrobiotus metropolitanus TaxID=2943436 RepID=UPI002445CC2F|nr:uncharacterized protein LOC129581924 isoform X2 [Paramacrobiotus metropolitanus]